MLTHRALRARRSVSCLIDRRHAPLLDMVMWKPHVRDAAAELFLRRPCTRADSGDLALVMPGRTPRRTTPEH